MEADELVGSLVDGRYTILEPMAAGSMGVVYKAERVPVGKTVAIKFLHASFANDPEFLARFERETRVMSKLAHPNCVSVVDFGVWESSPYLVMEYVGGHTLRSIIDDGPLPPARALGLARQITAGLAHAHAQGITHRDVKPANIMISEEIGAGEHVRILDFGLARLRGAAGRDATQSNVVVGTPNYMAPEQTVGGGTIDARTDVYAVGVVLFEMIAGERPFQAEDTLALLGMHRAAPIPRLADRAGDDVALPAGLQDVIEKAMAKSPDDRYPSAIAMAEAIDAVAGGRAGPDRAVVGAAARRTDGAAVAPTMLDVSNASAIADAERVVARRRSAGGGRGLAWTVLALLLLGGGGAAAWWLTRDRAAAPSGPVAAVAPADAAAVPVDAAVANIAHVGEAVDAAEPVTEDAAEAVAAADVPETAGEIEMAPDPTSADDPTPAEIKPPEPDDEDEDAPKTPEDVEKRAPAPARAATTIGQALQLIKAGKRELALTSLRALYKKSPNSAYIPFLMGNLYYDQRWWSVAMEHYGAAIARNKGYRRNAILNRNVIRMLVSKRTQFAAERFLRGKIGRAGALPHLQYVAKHDKNSYLRGQAARLARSIR